MISAGGGGFVKFFLSKHACFAFSQFRLFGVLVVAMFDKGVLGLRPKCASKGDIFVTPCGVIRKVLLSRLQMMQDGTVYLFYQSSLPLVCV